VRFNVNFPSQLSRQQQLLLRHTLQVRNCRAVVLCDCAGPFISWVGGRQATVVNRCNCCLAGYLP
jgi:hypothetical protein